MLSAWPIVNHMVPSGAAAIVIGASCGSDIGYSTKWTEGAPPGNNSQAAAAATAIASTTTMAASQRLDTAFLSGVQIDGQGRTNMSVIGQFDAPKVRLPGGAGSAAIMPRAKRTLIWRTKHDRRVFVDRLDFVTAAGNVDRVVTPLCVLRRVDGRLAVESRHSWASPEELAAATGFAIEVDESTPITPEIRTDEREALLRIDPDGVTLTEF